MAEILDHYRTLDVSETASASEIKRAYRGLVQAFHPDRSTGDASSLETFRSVQEAYEVLSDPRSRMAYDHSRKGPFLAQGHLSGHSDDRYAPRSGELPQGGDVETEVRLSFEQSLQGGSSEAQLSEGETALIPIPRGVRSGVKVRFKGRGMPDSEGTRGDLFVMFRVSPSPRFRREGNDLHIVEPITVWDALLGTSRGITNAYGRSIKVAIPPGTQPGERLRLRGQGVETASKKGDLYVEVRVTVPRSLTDGQREALSLCAKQMGLL